MGFAWILLFAAGRFVLGHKVPLTVGHQYRVPTEAEVAIVVPGLILLNVDADGIGPVNRVISVISDQ